MFCHVTLKITGLHHKGVYTHSGTSSPKCVHQILLLFANAYIHYHGNQPEWVHRLRIQVHFNKNAYMHEQTMIGYGVRIWGRKYLNECTPLLWCKPVIFSLK